MERDEGLIDLPLICDWPNRPKQKVCFEQGKAAQTEYQVLSRDGDGTTRVRLMPITGRSHQLRVHLLALGHPILGDGFTPIPPPKRWRPVCCFTPRSCASPTRNSTRRCTFAVRRTFEHGSRQQERTIKAGKGDVVTSIDRRFSAVHRRPEYPAPCVWPYPSSSAIAPSPPAYPGDARSSAYDRRA